MALTRQALTPWLICLTASLLFFYEIFQLAIFNTLALGRCLKFFLGLKLTGYIASSYLYACSIFLLPEGIILDKYSTRKILIIISSLCTIGVLFIFLAHNTEIILLGRILTGLGNAFTFLGCMRLIPSWFPLSRIAFVTGLTVTIGMSGGIVAQTPFILLVNAIGWRQAMIINVLVGLVITLLIFFIVQDGPRLNNDKKNANTNLTKFWHGLSLACQNLKNWLCGIYWLIKSSYYGFRRLMG